MKIHKVDGKEYYSFNCNEYIRTDKGEIFQNDEPWNLYPVESLKVKKTADRLIDLIEEGDIVNGMTVEEFDDEEGELYLGFPIYDDGLMDCIIEYSLLSNIKIKTILTHEQYEKNCYKVKE